MTTQPYAFSVKTVLIPLFLAGIIAIAGFALGHTQLEGHPVMAERVNDSMVRVGRLEIETENLQKQTHRLEVEGVDDRFRGAQARDMEDRLQEQLDLIKKDISHMKSELDMIKAELGIR